MPNSYQQDVRKLDLFRNIAQNSFDTLMRGAYIQNFPPRIELITEGGTPDFLHIVVTGTVELFAQWNGRETSMGTLRPVTTFILAATIRDSPYLMSARTLENSRVALIPSEDVRKVFETDSAFASAIVDELAQTYRTQIRATKELKLRSSLERLANDVLRRRNRAQADTFDLELEKRRLASLLGMTPENLSHAFKSLEKYGVRVKSNRITISDLSALQKFAKPNPLIDT